MTEGPSHQKGHKVAVIAGAGPAGLTAALELLERSDIVPLLFEVSNEVGGISRTHRYKGNRIDIGGHRFFSKSERVMAWWANILPTQGSSQDITLTYQNQKTAIRPDPNGPDPDTCDSVMLVRPRRSRILHRGKLFEYPLSLSAGTVLKLGLLNTCLIGASYLKAQALPRPESSLEDFFINRFGQRLYRTFFRDYTEKVWGVSCRQIPAEWGAQRIKGLSLTRALKQAVGKLTRWGSDQEIETSLIEQFFYPKFGPGQMWESVQQRIEAAGGTVALRHQVVGVERSGDKIVAAHIRAEDGRMQRLSCDYFFSTMPMPELFSMIDPAPPTAVREITEGLEFRDFITVGLLLRRLKLGDADGSNLAERMPDNWIYVQEPGVKVGRLQFFNNWSPYLVADPETVWIGLEYFCYQDDELWSLPDQEMVEFGVRELESIGVIEASNVLDGTVLRVPKTYPAYWSTYSRIDEAQAFVDGIQNLYLLGRNGMHRYNNQDHSMLTAMVAVDTILSGGDKSVLWSVNAEQEYHETR
jgi:protoporphyrinogen oxidase